MAGTVMFSGPGSGIVGIFSGAAFSRGGAGRFFCLVRYGEVLVAGLFHEGATGWQHICQ
jgi:hypothetical protein